MAEFVRVASVTEIPDPGKVMLEVGDRLVVLCHVGGQFFCIDDVCTHDGGPLGEGELDGYEIACPRHGAKFDVRSGCAKTMPATEHTASHDVKVTAGEIFVRIRDGADENSSGTAGAAVAGAVLGAAGDPKKDGDCCGGTGHAGSTLAQGSLASGGVSVSACASGGNTATNAVASGPLSEDHVREELKRVIDPELFVNIVDLGLVYEIDLSPLAEGGTKVRIDMTMTSPMCPAGPQLIAQCKQFVGQMPGVGQVEVKIVMDPPWTPEKMSDSARDQLGIF